MVRPAFDFVLNPLGAVRYTFEMATEASTTGETVASLDGKDWGVVVLLRSFLFDQGCLSEVPILNASTFPWIQPNTLVRFRGMVQDMFGKEKYVGAFKDGTIWRTNKFMETPIHPMHPACQAIYWERQLFYSVPIPGQYPWVLESVPSKNHIRRIRSCAGQNGEKQQRNGHPECMITDEKDQDGSPYNVKKMKEDGSFSSHQSQVSRYNSSDLQDTVLNADSNPVSCLVKVYDMPEGAINLKDVFEFIGIYSFDNYPFEQKENSEDEEFDLRQDALSHLPSNKVPRLHCLICHKLSVHDFLGDIHRIEPLPNLFRRIRESLLTHLTVILGNDCLAAECFLLHLLSRLRPRVDVEVGKLSLNLTGLTRESFSVFGKRLINSLCKILPCYQAITLSLEYLNTNRFQPRKDNNTGRLEAGILQLAEDTHLTLDETHLQAGTLDSNGVENARGHKQLMERLRMLETSEGKSNILPANILPDDLVVPFCPMTVDAVPNESHDQRQAWRWYLTNLRFQPYICEPKMLEALKDEIVTAMGNDRSVGFEDINRWLTMSQLMCASFGDTVLSLEHWQMVKEMEKHRRERLK